MNNLKKFISTSTMIGIIFSSFGYCADGTEKKEHISKKIESAKLHGDKNFATGLGVSLPEIDEDCINKALQSKCQRLLLEKRQEVAELIDGLKYSQFSGRLDYMGKKQLKLYKAEQELAAVQFYSNKYSENK